MNASAKAKKNPAHPYDISSTRSNEYGGDFGLEKQTCMSLKDLIGLMPAIANMQT